MITGNTRKYFVAYSVKSTFLETNGGQDIKEKITDSISPLLNIHNMYVNSLNVLQTIIITMSFQE